MICRMRVTVLASGSGGNASLISAGGAQILVDAGVGPKKIEARMRAVLGEVVSIDGLILTHPHGDHTGKANPVARYFDCPVWMTEATSRRLRFPHVRTRVFGFNAPFNLGAIQIEPMPLPHDAPNVALVFSCAGARAGLVTDLGHVPRKLAAHLAGCQLLLLESNHDPAMLAEGPYPEFLKKRIASRLGHLSNQQAAELAARLGRELRDIVLMHLSDKNNSAALATAQMQAALAGRSVTVRCAAQDQPLTLEVSRSRRARSPMRRAGQLALPF